MTVQKPVVRHFIACDEILTSIGGRKFTLVNLIGTLRLRPGALFPHTVPYIWLYAHLTDGRGRWQFGADIHFMNDDTLIFSTPRRILDLGQDPLIVHGVPIPINDPVFPGPGKYICHLMCDEVSIAEVIFQVG